MGDFHRQGIAIVIEAGELVDMLCEFLESFGYKAIPAPSHAHAAERALAHQKIALLATCVPAPDESLAGIYLEEAFSRNPQLPVVLMLSDPQEQSANAPANAVKLTKPFGRQALIQAIERAEAKAASDR